MSKAKYNLKPAAPFAAAKKIVDVINSCETSKQLNYAFKLTLIALHSRSVDISETSFNDCITAYHKKRDEIGEK